MSNIEILNSFQRTAHTHKIVVDILTKSLNVKTVEKAFNGFEKWPEGCDTPFYIAELMLSKLSPMLCDDLETIAWKATAYDLKTGLVFIDWHPHQNQIIYQN